MDVVDAQFGGRVGEGLVDGVVFEDDEGVEEGLARGEVGPLLDVEEGAALVATGELLVVLQAGKPGEGGGVVRDVEGDGEGVDEQAHHGLDVGDGRGASGYGGAEDDLVASGVAREQERPGA